METYLTWQVVKDIAQVDLGLNRKTVEKWRTRGTVPYKHRIAIVETLMKRGIAVSISEFERMDIAA